MTTNQDVYSQKNDQWVLVDHKGMRYDVLVDVLCPLARKNPYVVSVKGVFASWDYSMSNNMIDTACPSILLEAEQQIIQEYLEGERS